MQPPSILRTDNQLANLSDLLGLPAAPYFDFSYLPCIFINYSFDLCNYQLLYFLIVKDYKQATYVRVQSVFDVNIIQFQTQIETCFSSFSIIPALILNFNAILVQVLNQLILIPIITPLAFIVSRYPFAAQSRGLVLRQYISKVSYVVEQVQFCNVILLGSLL